VPTTTPRRPPPSLDDLLRESLAPLGHTGKAPSRRPHRIWSLVMLVVLVVALVLGYLLRAGATTAWGGDTEGPIVSMAPAPYPGDTLELTG
jgi:hypothetical protein